MSTSTKSTSQQVIFFALVAVGFIGLIAAGQSAGLHEQTEENVIVYGPEEAPSNFEKTATTNSISYEQASASTQEAFRDKQSELYSSPQSESDGVELNLDPTELTITNQVMELDGEYYYFAVEEQRTQFSYYIWASMVVVGSIAIIISMFLAYTAPAHIADRLFNKTNLTFKQSGRITIVALLIIGLLITSPIFGLSGTVDETKTTQVEASQSAVTQSQIISFEALSEEQKQTFIESVSDGQISDTDLQDNLGNELYIQSDGELYFVETVTVSTTPNPLYLTTFVYFVLIPYLGIIEARRKFDTKAANSDNIRLAS